ncbi:hypothetical protein WICPIJ_006200 [Wickerhamomyces pijperi]|uniref:PRELI/MSF1 domain-containing protein n=1 Tax=Wickerhamomyces pijperi TaxID=599730 RepID=A0A9P8Q4F5_WICPI|nr:hypothetical protein WICPIJ_006200 [Wickerhamomyces pijperi]
MRLFSNTCEFHYAWDQITTANWQKYPNEMSTHVIAVDVLRRELDPTGTILTSERLITCKQSIPKWLNTLIGGKEVTYVREVSVVDLNQKTLTLRSVNLTMSHLLKVYETVTYKPDSMDPDHKTVFNQEAQITAHATWSRIGDKVEEWSVERFGQNAVKGKLGFESVLSVVCPKEVSECINENIDIVKLKTGEFIKDSTEINRNLVTKTEKLLKEADSVLTETLQKTKTEIDAQRGLLGQYYDYFKEAFRR